MSTAGNDITRYSTNVVAVRDILDATATSVAIIGSAVFAVAVRILKPGVDEKSCHSHIVRFIECLPHQSASRDDAQLQVLYSDLCRLPYEEVEQLSEIIPNFTSVNDLFPTGNISNSRRLFRHLNDYDTVYTTWPHGLNYPREEHPSECLLLTQRGIETAAKSIPIIEAMYSMLTTTIKSYAQLGDYRGTSVRQLVEYIRINYIPRDTTLATLYSLPPNTIHSAKDFAYFIGTLCHLIARVKVSRARRTIKHSKHPTLTLTTDNIRIIAELYAVHSFSYLIFSDTRPMECILALWKARR